MMNWFKRTWYACKLMFSGYFVGAWVLGLALSIVTVNIEQWQFAEASLKSVNMMFTIVMPLVTVVLTANAFGEELEEAVLPLIWTYPASKMLLVIERLVLVLLLLVLYKGATLWAIHGWLLPINRQIVWEMIKAAAPVHLYLAGLTLLFSFIGRHMMFGLAAGAIYWLIELLTVGDWTRGLYLFQSVWPLEEYNPLVQVWWILGVAVIFVMLSLGISVFGRQWLAKK